MDNQPTVNVAYTSIRFIVPLHHLIVIFNHYSRGTSGKQTLGENSYC